MMRVVRTTMIGELRKSLRLGGQSAVVATVVCILVLSGCGRRTEVEPDSRAVQEEAEGTASQESALSPAKFAEALVAVGWAEAGSRKIQTPLGPVRAGRLLDYGAMLKDEDVEALGAIGVTKSDFVAAMKATMTRYRLNEYGNRVVDYLAEMK